MSFILDALRKSDQQRQRSGAPTLMTAQVPLAQPKPFAWWWYAILAAVLMGAGILIGWLHQWQSEPTDSALPAGAVRPLTASTQKFTPAPLPASLPALPASPGKPQQAPLPAAAHAPAQVAAAPAPALPESPRNNPAKPVLVEPQPATAIKPGAASAPAREQQPGPGSGDAAREPAVVALTDLPPALQQEIPKLAILAHSYSSKPRDRFVFINDQVWREAEYPWPGLKLEQITADGMIFSYKGYRFRRGTNP